MELRYGQIKKIYNTELPSILDVPALPVGQEYTFELFVSFSVPY